MANKRDAKPAFRGFRSPNYTQVPDELFDELLPELSGAELKVLLYIIRRTFGFKRDSDSISLSQMLNGIQTRDGQPLDRGAGVSKPTLLQALRSLEERRIIQTERRRSADKGDEPTVYRLRFAGNEEGGQKTVSPLVKEFDHGGGQEASPRGWSRKLTTQETGEQKTENTSKIRKAHAAKSEEKTGGTGTATNPSAPDRSVSQAIQTAAHNSVEEGETSEIPQAAVATQDASNTADQHSGASSDQTSGVGDSVTSGEGAKTSPGVGYQRLRDTAMKLRADRSRGEGEGRAAYPVQARSGSSELTPIAELLPAPRTRSRGSREERDHVAAFLKDFQHELGDEAPLSSSITRALNIFKAANIPLERWGDCLYQARSITKERTAQITKKPSEKATGYAAKNRAPYYFAILEDICGLREQADAVQLGTA